MAISLSGPLDEIAITDGDGNEFMRLVILTLLIRVDYPSLYNANFWILLVVLPTLHCQARITSQWTARMISP